jgi:nitrate/nitrite transport system ATP-binding protein
MAILELKNVSKGHGNTPVLKDITLAIEPGQFVVVLGFSGTGKTTLINLVAGLTTPDAGSVSFRGAPVAEPSPERALVFQSYALMPWLSVADNIALATDAVHKGKPKAERVAITDRYIRMVGLAHARDRKPDELSGGMRQRVAVARALAMEPEMLLMDEPLSALDALTRANLADEIERIWEAERRTVLMITNDVDEALVLADRILILNPDGTLGPDIKVTLPRPRDHTTLNDHPVFKALRARITQYLMEVGIAAKAPSVRRLPAVTARHALPSAYAKASQAVAAERYLQFSQIYKTYATPKGPLTVVKDFEFTMKRGEFVSIIGHSGCGKSTVLTMAAGLNDISAGSIILDGTHVQGADPERAVVFQSPNLMPWLTARENVAIGAHRVYPKATRAERQEVVEYYLEKVGLGDSMDRLAADMSNGMRQRVGIARAFALSPKLLLLDEPFGMLDSLTRWELQEVLMEVWSQTRVTAICVTHDVDEAILLSDRVVMMTNGPEATIGRVVEVDLARPRTRKALVEHADYYRFRASVLSFLEEYEHGAHPKKDVA